MKIIYNKPLYIDNISNLNILIKNYSSLQRITFYCQTCYKLHNTQLRNLQRNNKLICNICKTKETFNKKYGFDWFTQTSDYLNKIEKTNIKKYGVKHTFQAESVKKKSRETCKNKYGVDSTGAIKSRIQKTKNTNIKKYGHSVAYGFGTNEFKKLYKEKYGNEEINLVPSIRQKMKMTNLENFGTEFASQSDIIKEKVKETMIKHWGVSYCLQNKDILTKKIKRYTYNNISFDSKPEIAYYIWLTDNNINFEYQPDISFEYEYNGKMHKYFPDFLVEDEIQEIKGLYFFENKNINNKMINPHNRNLDDLAEAKHQCMIKNNVKIITDYNKFLLYVKNKYGNNYLKQFKNK